MQEMYEAQVLSLGQEDSLEKEMATHSSVLAWRIPQTEEPGGFQSMGSQRVRHNYNTMSIYIHLRQKYCIYMHVYIFIYKMLYTYSF